MPLVLNSSSISGLAPVGGLSSPQTGSVLQVVSFTKTDSFSTASTSFVEVTGFSATITPTSATSKILILVVSNQSTVSSSGLTTYNLIRDSTNICQPATSTTFTGSMVNYVGIADNVVPFSISFLDSPATTSATTYKMQVKSNTNTVYINRRVTADVAITSTITLMEIAA
jgi:hypothetical protein